mgnify:CR=1 FL=1
MPAENVVEYIVKIKTKAAEQGLDDLTADLSKLLRELKKADKQGGESFKKTKESAKKTNDQLKKTQKQSSRTKDALKEIGRVRSVFGKVQFALAGIVAGLGATIVAAFKVTQKVTDLTNELNDLSVRSGVTADSIQGLRQSLLASGQPASELNTILSGVATRFSTLAIKGGAVEKKFNDMGIAVLDANGKLRSNNDIMLDGIKKLQSIEDASERSRVAVLLFGKAGSKLNQALAAGNFENFLKFTEKFGIDTGPEASKAAADFQVALSSLQTVMNGSLQRLVNLADAQNKTTRGMITLGSTVVFTVKLIEGLTAAYEKSSKVTKEFLDFAINPLVYMIEGPLNLAIYLHIKALEFMGFEVDNLRNKINDFLGIARDAVVQNNSLASAFNDAYLEAKEFNDAVVGFSGSMSGLASASENAGEQIAKLGKEAKKTKEEIRTLMDVVDDLLDKFTSFNVNKFVSDFAIGFAVIDKIINKSFNTSKIDLFVNTLNSSLRRATTQIDFKEGVSVPEVTFEGSFMSGFEELLTKIKVGIGEIFSISIKGLERSTAKISGALSKGLSAGASLAVTGVLAVLKIAEGLGQRGSTVKEVQKSVEDDIRARAKAIELGLRVLPRILFKTLPPLFVEFADRVVFGFFKSIAEFVNILKDFFRSIFTREGRQERREARGERQDARTEEFKRRLDVLFGIASKRGGGPYIPSARGGIKFTGADEGLAMLHRGEYVVPETGQMPQAVQRTMGMGQGGMTININAAVVESNAIDELVRQIERRFQTFGSSTSPLFGGR